MAAVQNFLRQSCRRAVPVQPGRFAVRVRQDDDFVQSIPRRGDHQHGQPVPFARAAYRQMRHGVAAGFAHFARLHQQLVLGKMDLQGVPPRRFHHLLEMLQRLPVARPQRVQLRPVALDQRLNELFLRQRALRQLPIRPHAQCGVRFFGVSRFFQRRRVGQFQHPFAEPVINRLATRLVVVMIEIKSDVAQPVLRVEQFVDARHRRSFDRQGHFGPIARGGDENLRTRCGHGGNLHVRVIYAQAGRILARTTALHRVRHHHNWRLRRQPIFHGAEHERLRAAARLARARQPRFVRVRQRLQKIQRPDAVPGLQSHQADVPEQVHLVRGEAPMPFVKFLARRPIGKSGVVVADHVVGKRDHPLIGEVDASGGDAAFGRVCHPPVGPVPVRVQDRRERPVALPQRPIQIARQIKSGIRLEIDLLDAVTVALDLAEDVSVQRRFLRQRPQPATDEDIFADLFGPRFPFSS